MKGPDLTSQEFMFLYDLLSAQFRSDTDPALVTLRNKFRNGLVEILEDKEKGQFEKWENEQKRRIGDLAPNK
jgi:hypothetical protein